MKFTWTKAAALVAILAVAVPATYGSIVFGATVLANIDDNSTHSLKAEIERLTDLKIKYEITFPEPRDIAVVVQIRDWERRITIAEEKLKKLLLKGN